MRIIIKYQVDSSDWSDEDFDNNTDRELVLDEIHFFQYLKEKGYLKEKEFIHDIISVELKHR